jgi:phosphate transport system permease protein
MSLSSGLSAREASRSLRADSPRIGEKLIITALFIGSTISVFATIAIVVSLFVPLPSFFSQVSIVEFFTATQWSPGFANAQYGVVPIVV